MLVKCAVQVNQCYEEINLTQFLLLMNFSISCKLCLWSVLLRQSSFSSSSAASVNVSPCEEGMECCFRGEPCPLATDQNVGFWCDGSAGALGWS